MKTSASFSGPTFADSPLLRPNPVSNLPVPDTSGAGRDDMADTRPVGVPSQVITAAARRATGRIWLVLALLGPLTLPGQTLLFFEGFEGAFPGFWTVQSVGSTPTWRDVNSSFGGEGTHTGSWKGYCAGSAYAFGSTDPNPQYTNNMGASMSRPIALGGCMHAELSFWHKVPSIEATWDWCRVYVDTNLVWSLSSAVTDWTQVRIDLTPYVGAERLLKFLFTSDGSVVAEGWYLDDIEVTATYPFTHTHVGDGPVGSFATNGVGAYTIEGGGNDIWDATDAFDFAWTRVSGDFDVRVRVLALDPASRWSKAGIMVRESLAPDSRMGYLKVSPFGPLEDNCGSTQGAADVSFMYRNWIPGDAGVNGGRHEDRIVLDPGYPAYSWLRLRRLGNVLEAYASTDGAVWIGPVVQDTAHWVWPVGGTATPLAQTVLLGLAGSRHPCAQVDLCESQFANYANVLSEPPILVTQPLSQTVEENREAEFSFEMTGGYDPATFTIQWLRHGTPIPGANQREYRTLVNLADDGATYSVSILNHLNGSSVTSDTAILHVLADTTPPVCLSAQAPTPNQVVLRFDEMLDSISASTIANYWIEGGNISEIDLSAAGTVVTLVLASPLMEGHGYQISITNVKDLSGNAISATGRDFNAPVWSPGWIRQEEFQSIRGTAVADLTNHRKYPYFPDRVQYVTQLEGPRDRADDYGLRLSGWLVPPVSGDHHFWIASDDASELWLSTDANPANRQRIAFEPLWNGFRDYQGLERRNPAAPENRSAGLSLIAGQRYYFEVLLKEGLWWDHVSVAWQVPGQTPPANGHPPIGREYLGCYADPGAIWPTCLEQPVNWVHILDPHGLAVSNAIFTTQWTAAGQNLAPVFLQWQRDSGSGWVSIPGATQNTYSVISPRLAENGTAFRVLASVPGSTAVSDPAWLTVVHPNLPPRYTPGPDQQVPTCSGLHTVPFWAGGVQPYTVDVAPFEYESDFAMLPAGSILHGNATVDDGRLKLTVAANDQFGAFQTPRTWSWINRYHVRFSVYLGGNTCCGDPLTCNPNSSADGFSVNIATDLPEDGAYSSPAEEGVGSGLSVCFDTWANDTNEAPAIEIKWRGALLARKRLCHLSQGANPPRFVPVEIRADGRRGVTVIYDGTNVFADVALPGFAAQAGLQVGLAARTGAANDNHWIDDLNIQLDPASEAMAESGQQVQFIVTNDHPALFSIQPAISPEGTLTFAPAPGTNGVATVTVVLKDDGGTAYGGQDSTAPQTFQITVLPDNEPPLIACPADLVLDADAGQCSKANVSYPAVTVTDNCPGVQVRFNPVEFSSFPVGTNVVTMMAEDAAGNSSSGTFRVIIRDREPPAFVAGPEKWVPAGSAWTFDAPTAVWDACGGTNMALSVWSTITNSACHGSDIVRTWRAIDAAGNQTFRSQTVHLVEQGAIIDIRKISGGNVSVEWTCGSFALETAEDVRGPWSEIAGATSPYVTACSKPKAFFRLRAGEVYSVNAVGYVNLQISEGINLLANPLIYADNRVAQILSVPERTVVYKYDPAAGYSINTLQFGNWTDSNMELVPGEGFFLRVESAQTLTMVGEVPQGTLSQDLPAGYSLQGSQVPEAINLGDPEVSFPLGDGDLVYRWQPAINGYTIFAYAKPDPAQPGQWLPNAPVIQVGEGFFLRKGAAATWTRGFDINAPGSRKTSATVPSKPVHLSTKSAEDPGWIHFSTRVPILQPPLDAPVRDANGTRVSGSAFLAQVYAGNDPVALSPVGEPVSFEDGLLAGYLFGGAVPVDVVVPGMDAFFQVRAWAASDGPTYEAALVAQGTCGRSKTIAVTAGGAGVPPALPADLIGLEPFSLSGPSSPAGAPVWIDFNAGLPPDSVLAGNAYVGTNGALHLTDAVNAQQGSFIFDAGCPLSCFRARFKALVGDPTSGNPVAAADGFSFCFGSDVAGSFGDEGTGSGLIVSFDTHDNGDEDAPSIDLKWNGTPFAHAAHPVVTGNPAEFVDVGIELTAAGYVTVSYGGAVVHRGVPIPGFSALTNTARFGFGARTGSLNAKHWIDDLCLNDYGTNAMSVTLDPTDPLVPEGGQVTFTATAQGAPCHYFQWFRNEVPVAGAIGPSYTTPPLHCGQDDGARYSVMAVNLTSSATASSTVQCDGQPPALICPRHLEFLADPEQCSRSNVVFTVTVTDDRPGVTYKTEPRRGSTFPAGVTPVICTATDAAGNTSQCTFLIVIKDLRICSNADGTCTIEWSCPGVLQSAPEISGPFTDMSGITSPYRFFATGICRYFRLRR